jgi:hypothetical protein
MILKILMENSDEFRWLAMLLDARPPQKPIAGEAEAGP